MAERTGSFSQTIFSLCTSILQNAGDFAFPPLCILCNEPVDRSTSRWLCGSCRGNFLKEHSSRQACERCAQNTVHRRCACNYAWSHPFERVFSFIDYTDTCRKIMHEIKYRGKKNLAREMGSLFAGSIPVSLLKGIDTATVIPLHFTRKRSRGYNQAEQFASGVLSGRQGIAFLPNLLARKRATKTQTKLSREERKKNLGGAFVVRKQFEAYLTDRNVLLIDDVVTTGATTGECSQVLLNSGARSVRVLSMVRD